MNIELHIGWFIFLICTNFFVLMAVMTILYIFAGIHDWFAKTKKPTKNEENCPYERDDK